MNAPQMYYSEMSPTCNLTSSRSVEQMHFRDTAADIYSEYQYPQSHHHHHQLQHSISNDSSSYSAQKHFLQYRIQQQTGGFFYNDNATHQSLEYEASLGCGGCNRMYPMNLIAKRNERERNRVKTINQTFARLRQHLPCSSTRSRKLSKVQILKLAAQYIERLQQVLDDEQSPDKPAMPDDAEQMTTRRAPRLSMETSAMNRNTNTVPATSTDQETIGRFDFDPDSLSDDDSFPVDSSSCSGSVDSLDWQLTRTST